MLADITGLENVGMPLSLFIAVIAAALTAGVFLIIRLLKSQ
ncbi:hypothetical protein [Alkalicoccus saliphilus]|jgi:hypothetical protein|nr:hypothetical protein [Alkalicoccus saliphilus]